jgi:hypothetical protein
MARVITTADDPAGFDFGCDTAETLTRRIGRQAELEFMFSVWYRGEVCKRSFDGWRQIHLCNAAKGEIFTRRPVR